VKRTRNDAVLFAQGAAHVYAAGAPRDTKGMLLYADVP
jgi:hypothetical protein